MATDTLTLYLDPALKVAAEHELAQMGLSLTTYLTLALHQLVIQRAVPFTIKAANHPTEDIPTPATRRAIIKALAEEEGLIEDEGPHFTNAQDTITALLRDSKE